MICWGVTFLVNLGTEDSSELQDPESIPSSLPKIYGVEGQSIVDGFAAVVIVSLEDKYLTKWQRLP
jgi:hypothetical protein